MNTEDCYSVISKKNGTRYFLHARNSANGSTKLYFFAKEVKGRRGRRIAGRQRSLRESGDGTADPKEQSLVFRSSKPR